MTIACDDIHPLPRVILQAVANDSDKGPNSDLEYSLCFDNDTQQMISTRNQGNNKTVLASDAPWFEIDPRTGEISLVAVDEMPSRCQSSDKRGKRKSEKYGLIVSAIDKGEPRLTATISVQIQFVASDQELFESASVYFKGNLI